MNQSALAELRADGNYIYSKAGATDYSRITDAYLLIYMPVNFYKIWKPLYQLAEVDKLPLRCKILELGAGPGTATLGLISFYAELAIGNPNVEFSLDIVAVEREPKFEDIFLFLTDSYVKTCPENLSISVKAICGDALKYLPEYGDNYDFIIESNMLNSSEDVSTKAVESFTNTIEKALGAGGYVISIEPGKKENRVFLASLLSKISANEQKFKVIASPLLTATDISEISLYNEACEAGLRGVRKAEHWFTYIILEKNGGICIDDT